MDNYIVSARKYRPATFNSVVGQRSLTTTLKNAISSGKLAHAYLFCGPRGVGKTTCARIFAKTINCLTPTAEHEACNECESCKAFNEQRSYNIHELDAASNNGVDDIRSLIEQVRIPPQIGKYKVYIIDEVHMLSQAAFNAFLKTLEEPPKHAIFILATTERHKVLPTILSRCQIYDFSRITIKDIVDHLQYVADQEGVKTEAEALNVLAQKADGGMRDALSIFDQVVSFTAGNVTYQSVIDNLNVLDYEYYFKLTDFVLEGNVSDGLLTLNEILSKGFDGNNVLTGLAAHFRDLLLCKDPRTAELFEVGASIRQRYVDMAKKCDIKILYKAIDILNEADMNYRLSRNKRLLCDLTIIRICQLSSPDLDADSQKKKRVIIKPIFTKPKEQHSPAQHGQTTTTAAPRSRANVPQTSTKRRNATHTPGSAGGLGISLNAMLHGKKDEVKQQEKALESQHEKFTAEKLVDFWNIYAEKLEEEHHLRNTMLSCLPEMLSETKFEIVVNNTLQEDKILEDKGNILRFLRTQLKNTSIDFDTRISENNEKKQAFTPSEKLNLMMEENESIRRLKDSLGLELS